MNPDLKITIYCMGFKFETDKVVMYSNCDDVVKPNFTVSASDPELLSIAIGLNVDIEDIIALFKLVPSLKEDRE